MRVLIIALLLFAGCIQDEAVNSIAAPSLEAGDGFLVDKTMQLELVTNVLIDEFAMDQVKDDDFDGPVPVLDGVLLSTRLQDSKAMYLFGNGHNLDVVRQSDLADMDFNIGITKSCAECDPILDYFSAQASFEFGVVKYPLEVGASWETKFDRTLGGRATVTGWQDITTPAGTFEALHILHELEPAESLWDHDSENLELSWQVNAWFAPELGMIVKQEEVYQESQAIVGEYRGHDISISQTLTSTDVQTMMDAFQVEQNDLDEDGVAAWLDQTQPRTESTSLKTSVDLDLDLDSLIDQYEAEFGTPETPQDPLSISAPKSTTRGETLTVTADGALTATLHGDVISTGMGRIDFEPQLVGNVVITAERDGEARIAIVPVHDTITGTVTCAIVVANPATSCSGLSFESFMATAAQATVEASGLGEYQLTLKTHEGTTQTTGNHLNATVESPADEAWELNIEGLIIEGAATATIYLWPEPMQEGSIMTSVSMLDNVGHSDTRLPAGFVRLQ